MQPALFPPGSDFVWAAGIEDTFIPQARPGFRPLDEYDLTQHYQQWEQDFAMAESLGVHALRWGIPWYRVQPAPDRFDWDWTDRAIEALVERHNIAPIIDLMHYGTPLWLENSFINASYPQRVAEFAAAVARRYSDRVHVFTPLNEPMVNAEFCGAKGIWPPYLEGDDGYVKLVDAVARGIALTVQALRAEAPGALLVQVEALWHFWTNNPERQAGVAQNNAAQYLAFDLASGRVDGQYPLLPFLLQHGVSERDLEWFQGSAARFDVLGANFYPWSYGELVPGVDGQLARAPVPTPGEAIAQVIRDAYQRTGLPVMVTETSANAPVEGRAQWMDETIAAVFALRQEGLPVVGYTWFPMLTMIDWSYRTSGRPLEDHLLHLGLFDSHLDSSGRLVRNPTPLVERYREYIRRPVPPIGPAKG